MDSSNTALGGGEGKTLSVSAGSSWVAKTDSSNAGSSCLPPTNMSEILELLKMDSRNADSSCSPPSKMNSTNNITPAFLYWTARLEMKELYEALYHRMSEEEREENGETGDPSLKVPAWFYDWIDGMDRDDIERAIWIRMSEDEKEDVEQGELLHAMIQELEDDEDLCEQYGADEVEKWWLQNGGDLDVATIIKNDDLQDAPFEFQAKSVLCYILKRIQV
jgi:hypothetical protein